MPIIGLALAATGAVAGEYLRHDLIEPVARAAACIEKTAPWWCLLRDVIRIAAQNYIIAGLALIAAIASLLYQGKPAIAALAIAMLLAGSGLYLYSTLLSSVALVIALLRTASLDRSR